MMFSNWAQRTCVLVFHIGQLITVYMFLRLLTAQLKVNKLKPTSFSSCKSNLHHTSSKGQVSFQAPQFERSLQRGAPMTAPLSTSLNRFRIQPQHLPFCFSHLYKCIQCIGFPPVWPIFVLSIFEFLLIGRRHPRSRLVSFPLNSQRLEVRMKHQQVPKSKCQFVAMQSKCEKTRHKLFCDERI